MVKKKLKLRKGYNHVRKLSQIKNIFKNKINISKTKKKVFRKRKKRKSSKKSRYQSDEDEGPGQLTIYCIANTSYFTNKGNIIESVARGLLGFYNKLSKDRVKVKALDDWEDSGEKLVIFKGINHNHLKFLADDLHFAAIDTYPFYSTWGKSRIMLVLSAIGKEEDLEEIFEGLTYLR